MSLHYKTLPAFVPCGRAIPGYGLFKKQGFLINSSLNIIGQFHFLHNPKYFHALFL